ncbi:MAG: hypothetical protein HC809_09710 [Gammaproteobacteria bacterium]|nr:hypothetical protein [Gammaproteobacteria bacterium]
MAQAYAPAFAGLGYIFQVGEGVARDNARAEALYRQGAALGDLTSSLRFAELLMARGDVASTLEALTWFGVAADLGDANARNAVAWILATSKHDDVRNGGRAVSEAEAVVAAARSANTLDTLAAAYAETGRFPEAVSTQELALGALTDQERAADADYTTRLTYYQTGKPWRE